PAVLAVPRNGPPPHILVRLSGHFARAPSPRGRILMPVGPPRGEPMSRASVTVTSTSTPAALRELPLRSDWQRLGMPRGVRRGLVVLAFVGLWQLASSVG